MNEFVNIEIDGKMYKAHTDETVLKVCDRVGIDIPALCYNEALKPYGACRLCIVEVLDGSTKKGITTSCTLTVKEGLKIATNSDKVNHHRKVLFELYLSQAPNSEQLKQIAKKYGVDESRFKPKKIRIDNLDGKCILCGQCVRVCNEVMNSGAINYIGRGSNTKINTPFFEKNDVCMGCKACVEVCPTGAINFHDSEDRRIMVSWSNTEVELEKCSECGRYFAPNPLIKFSYNKIDIQINNELKNLCPECKKKIISNKELLSKKGIFKKVLFI